MSKLHNTDKSYDTSKSYSTSSEKPTHGITHSKSFTKFETIPENGSGYVSESKKPLKRQSGSFDLFGNK